MFIGGEGGFEQNNSEKKSVFITIFHFLSTLQKFWRKYINETMQKTQPPNGEFRLAESFSSPYHFERKLIRNIIMSDLPSTNWPELLIVFPATLRQATARKPSSSFSKFDICFEPVDTRWVGLTWSSTTFALHTDQGVGGWAGGLLLLLQHKGPHMAWMELRERFAGLRLTPERLKNCSFCSLKQLLLANCFLKQLLGRNLLLYFFMLS